MSAKDIASVVTAPKTTRSLSFQPSRHSSSRSIYRAQAVAKKKLARLKLKHLQDRQKLEAVETVQKCEEQVARKRQQETEEAVQQCKREEEQVARRRRQKTEKEEARQSIELMKASQELQEASLERQVLDEEFGRGGYISMQIEPDQKSLPKPALNKHVAYDPTTAKPSYPLFSSPEEKVNLPIATYLPGSVDAILKSELRVPKFQIPNFKGDPMQYVQFICTFKSNI